MTMVTPTTTRFSSVYIRFRVRVISNGIDLTLIRDYQDVNRNGRPDIGEPGVNADGKVYADGKDNDGDGEVDEFIDDLDWSPTNPTLVALVYSSAAAFAASAAATSLTQPLDTIKARVHVQQNGEHVDGHAEDDGLWAGLGENVVQVC